MQTRHSSSQDNGSPSTACAEAITNDVQASNAYKYSEQRRHQQHPAVAVLNVGGVDDNLHQQAMRIDPDVALLALDLLAGVVSSRA